MGRKKKISKSDARGYSQGPSLPKLKSTSTLKQQTHNEMKELLSQFPNQSHHQPLDNSSVPSNRFSSKLSNIVDKLDELSFTETQIERTVLALQYEITLESALDYLCLNVDTLELPPLFTDRGLREELKTETTVESFVVLSNDGKRTDEIELEDNILAATKVHIKGDKEVKEDDDKLKQKEWLLRHYEYEDEGKTDNTVVEEVMPQPQPLTPDEQAFIEKEKELRELQEDLNNDANNYMRSKVEIKELQIQAKKLKQQVDGMKKKVERNQRQLDVNIIEGAEVNQNDHEENYGGCFDIFGWQRNDDAAPTVETPHQQQTRKKPLDYTIPKGWTGTSPEKKLEEVCRKQKLPKPKYTKLPRNEGFCLSVTVAKNQRSMKWEALTNDFLPNSSLKDYLAVHALYEIDSTVQLHLLFPPSFRNLWMSWENKKADERNTSKLEHNEAKQQRIGRLVSLIAGLQSNKSDDNKTFEDKNVDTYDNVIENWDDEDSMNSHTMKSKSNITSLGKKLHREFIEKQRTDPFIKMKLVRDGLPMALFRDNIVNTVRDNAVTILAAETGAGKTTQCPQYLLEDALLAERGDCVNIICTQPRRVAATSVAARVSEEMCGVLGEFVGYHIRNEARKSARTKLLFCTTGVVLRRLQDDPTLDGVTHVLVDEVHERQQQTDVLLVILRQLLNTTRPDLKVILMSATLDSNLFCSFFNGAPVIRVPGRTYPVKNYYLEDIIEATSHVIEEGSRCAKFESSYTEQTSLYVTQRGGDKRKEVVDLTSTTIPIKVSSLYDNYTISTRRSMERVNEEVINFDLIEDLLIFLLVTETNHFNTNFSTGSILVFLPGLGEIKSMVERLEGNRHFNNNSVEIIPMHSTLSTQDQRKAFVPSKMKKIILSTNIAETSVTIPDVVCVIDTGRVKELRQSKRFLTSQLVTDWCSKASAKQRAGRAGRVQSGICLKLYSSRTANQVMRESSLPELQRVPLEEICLSILASGFAKTTHDFLSQAPEPPSAASIESALRVLQDIGAIVRNDTTNIEYLSPLGKHLAKLPVNVRLGKMLVHACMFNCLDPILTIAASLSSQSPFSTFINDSVVAKAKQRAFMDPDSDFMTYVNVWDAYNRACKTSACGKAFCRKNYLNQVSLREIGNARKQFLDLLSSIGFLDLGEGNINEEMLKLSSFNKHSKKLELVHAVICAGLYPNIARLDNIGSDHALWHKDERLYFHNTSVNAKKCYSLSEKWVVYDEKFGTAKHTAVSITAFINPLALILFGGDIVVKHIERLVIVDEWIEINSMPAQTGVLLREIKKQVDNILQKMIDHASTKDIDDLESAMVDSLSKILSA